MNSNLQLYLLCSDLLKKLLEAELQTGPCFLAKGFQSCFILAVFSCSFLRKQPADFTCCVSPTCLTCCTCPVEPSQWLRQHKSLGHEHVAWQRSPRQALALPLLHLQTGPAGKIKTVWGRRCSLPTAGLVWTKKLSFLVFAEAQCHHCCSQGDDAVPLMLWGCMWAQISPPKGGQAAAPGWELSLPRELSCKQDISSE